jgi:uncharacterized protein
LPLNSAPGKARLDHTQLINGFYAAFQRRDAATMAGCYAPDATFQDPVFRLEGWRIGAMWRMLCERGKDLRLEFRDVASEGDRGSAQWEAWYTFSATRRPVHNVISAEFVLRDGLILRHVDSFPLYRWTRQALGLKGWLLGWTPPVQAAIRGQAAKGLDAFVRQHHIGPEKVD